jgi:dihydropteroate synthase
MMNLVFGQKTLIMGIVNTTPDSFYDGGKYARPDQAFAHAMQLYADGADIVDIGGESSRPGAETISDQQEIDRVCPVIERIMREKPDAFISVDTTKSSVAREACTLGVQMINDISGLHADEEIARVSARFKTYLVLMHMRGNPQNMQDNTGYTNLCSDIIESLQQSASKALQEGISSTKIIIDPGIGFSKTVDQNYEIIAGLHRFKTLGYPILIGLSRKSLIGKIIPDGGDRLPATIALDAISALNGADIVRVHDVKEHLLALKAVDMLRRISA